MESYGTKGEAIVEMNNKAVDKGIEALVEIEVPAHWADAKEQETEIKAKEVPEFIENVLIPMSRQEEIVFQYQYLRIGQMELSQVGPQLMKTRNCSTCTRMADR